MVRTIVSVAALFGALLGGIHLVRESGAGDRLPTASTQPRLGAKTSDGSESREAAGERVSAPKTTDSPRLGRAPAATDSSRAGGTCEDGCCGIDGLPPPGVLPPAGHVMPLDWKGRLFVASDLDSISIPVPIPQSDDLTQKSSPFRLVSAEEESADDNEPKDGAPVTDETNSEAPPTEETTPETSGPPAADDAEPVVKKAPVKSAGEPRAVVKPVELSPIPDANQPAPETPEAPAAKPVDKDPVTPSDEFSSTPAKPKTPVVLSPEQLALREKVRTCLSHYYFQRQENVASRSPWGLMHCLISYGVDTQIIANNRRVNAIGWLSYNGMGKGQNLFYVQNGKLQARIGVGVQGHAGQYLAMMAQSRVKPDFPMLVEGRKFTIADLIEHEKVTCKAGTELTFKLIAFSYYLPSDAKWKNDQGEDWDIPRVIREELKQPIVGAACGGTHRLMGLTYAVRKRAQRGEPMDGQWLRAKKFIEAYQEYLLRLQNPDGSFSTDWFVGRGDNGKPTRKLETTGHMLEWLVYSLPEQRLTEPRVVRAIDFLANLLLSDPYGTWNIGPQGHGLHALALYDERVFGGKPGERASQLAQDFKQLRR